MSEPKIVIGAGAAGLTAAAVCAERGGRVLLIEKMERPGRKLRITGKGRCNVTNDCPAEEFLRHVRTNPRFCTPRWERSPRQRPWNCSKALAWS